MYLKDIKEKKCTGEDNKNVICCYFKSNSKQREYRKRMIEFQTESSRFKKTSQLANRAGLILKKGWFIDLRILEMIREINLKEQ